jgi:hypothetical protein
LAVGTSLEADGSFVSSAESLPQASTQQVASAENKNVDRNLFIAIYSFLFSFAKVKEML